MVGLKVRLRHLIEFRGLIEKQRLLKQDVLAGDRFYSAVGLAIAHRGWLPFSHLEGSLSERVLDGDYFFCAASGVAAMQIAESELGETFMRGLDAVNDGENASYQQCGAKYRVLVYIDQEIVRIKAALQRRAKKRTKKPVKKRVSGRGV